MKSWPAIALVAASLALTFDTSKAQNEVASRNIEYAQHSGTKLTGDLYLRVAKAPLIIAVHGGGWQNGSPAAFKYWGSFLAKKGYGLFAIKYRLGKAGLYPGAVYDVKAAIQFARANGADLGIDPERIGLWGDSAGGIWSPWSGSQPTSSVPNTGTILMLLRRRR